VAVIPLQTSMQRPNQLRRIASMQAGFMVVALVKAETVELRTAFVLQLC